LGLKWPVLKCRCAGMRNELGDIGYYTGHGALEQKFISFLKQLTTVLLDVTIVIVVAG